MLENSQESLPSPEELGAEESCLIDKPVQTNLASPYSKENVCMKTASGISAGSMIAKSH